MVTYSAAWLARYPEMAEAAAVPEFAPVSVPMEAVQVAPHAYYVPGQSGMVSTSNEGFNSNAGFVVTPEGVVVFDALGTPALGKRLADIIASKTSQPVRHVVVSHYHSDHFYGVQAFDRPGVEDLQCGDWCIRAHAGTSSDARASTNWSRAWP